MKRSTRKLAKFILVILVISLITNISPVYAKKGVKSAKAKIKARRVNREIIRFEEYLPLNIPPEFFLQQGMDPFPDKSYYRVNVYGIDVGDGVVLIDAGDEILAEELHNLVTRKFEKPVIAVYVTHGHADHAGGGLYFKNLGIPVYASSIDAFTIIASGADSGYYVPEEFTYTGYDVEFYLDYLPLEDGFTAIPTPGHTMGSYSISYQDGDDYYLFTSDTLLPDPKYARNPKDQTYVLSYFTLIQNQIIYQQYGIDLLTPQYESIQYIESISGEYDRLCPGHYKPVRSRRMSEYIQMSLDTILPFLP